MLFEGGFTFANFLTDVFAVFLFVVWFWLLILTFSDLFRREDISGWGKALWVIFLLLLPYLGLFAYIISQGKGMAVNENMSTGLGLAFRLIRKKSSEQEKTEKTE